MYVLSVFCFCLCYVIPIRSIRSQILFRELVKLNEARQHFEQMSLSADEALAKNAAGSRCKQSDAVGAKLLISMLASDICDTLILVVHPPDLNCFFFCRSSAAISCSRWALVSRTQRSTTRRGFIWRTPQRTTKCSMRLVVLFGFVVKFVKSFSLNV